MKLHIRKKKIKSLVAVLLLPALLLGLFVGSGEFTIHAAEMQAESELPSEPESELPSEPESELPLEPESELPSEPESELPSEPESELPSEPESELPSEPESELPSEPVDTEPLAVDGIAITQQNFPDALLLAFASAQDGNQDGALQPDELLNVTEFLYSDQGITDLKGLEHFTKLQKMDVSGNQITDFGVLGSLPELEVLKVSRNPAANLDLTHNLKLKRLIASDGALQSVTLSGLVALEEAYLDGNQLTTLDAGSLGALRILVCNGNQLTSLDVSACPELETLQADHNQISGLGVAGLSKLKNLECQNNLLTSIDLTGLDALTQLNVSNNQLADLSVANLGNLRNVFAGGNALTGEFQPGMASVVSLEGNGISGLTATDAVTYLNCRRNQLTNLSLTSAGLTHLYCSDNKLASLNLSDTSTLVSLYCENNHLASADVGDHVLDLRLSPQTTSLVRYRNGSNHWSDLKEAVGEERIGRMEVAVGGDVLSYDKDNGMVYYGNAAQNLTYQYLAGEGQSARMTVTASLTESDQTTEGTDTNNPPIVWGDAGTSEQQTESSEKTQEEKHPERSKEREDADDENYTVPVIGWEHAESGASEQKPMRVMDENGREYLLQSKGIEQNGIQQILEGDADLRKLLEELDHQKWVEIYLENENGRKVQPSGKVQFILSYPEGADLSDQFTIVHIENGENPVVLEEGTDYTLEENGILIIVDSFSPFVIAWNETAAGETPQESAETATEETLLPPSDSPDKQETGMSAGWVILIVLLLGGGATGIYFYQNRQKNKKE